MNSAIEVPDLILASRNEKKCREISELLSRHGITVRRVCEFDSATEVVEDGHSFAENAAKKASEPAKCLQRWVLAEDSGLMIDALDGAPGIYSARYSGENATDEENNAKMVEELQGVPDESRGAMYVCHVAVADPVGDIRLELSGTCRGRITAQARGTNGFGYDPYFLIPEYGRTFGELTPLVKSKLGHRARAFERVIRPLVRLLYGRSCTASNRN